MYLCQIGCLRNIMRGNVSKPIIKLNLNTELEI